LSLGFDGHHFINGLASHFRDLMVCQHQETIALLEVGESARERYAEQAKNTSDSFLLKALDLANDCDLKYKTSKNQRLLVELTLMKLASIDFDGQKKNPDSLTFDDTGIDLIVPASFFKGRKAAKTNPEIAEHQEEFTTADPKPGPTIAHQAQMPVPQGNGSKTTATTESEDPNHSSDTQIAKPALKTEIKKPDSQKLDSLKPDSLKPDSLKPDSLKKVQLDLASKRVSALSLSSLKAKKEHRLSKKEEEIDESQLPKEDFTEEEMQKHWAEFVEKIDGHGRKILASSLTTDIPKMFDDTTIWIELPNDTMKKEVEREQHDLMTHLKKQLNNHVISLRITVNEETAKKFAFTPEEKYQKLREKNPAIDLLRQTFDLDL
ncbi:MAG TPA: DNA polymerase III subunit gamma/tau, partial [Pricia sp.]|nr:DNA polymerase III subunit gamma/tau [Pricia sp.]